MECKDWSCKVHRQRANNGWIKSPNQLEDEMEKGEGEYMWRLRHLYDLSKCGPRDFEDPFTEQEKKKKKRRVRIPKKMK